jgi:hypothetical protein
MDIEKKLTAVQPSNKVHWVVLNDKAALAFGPDNKANCFKFINEFAEQTKFFGKFPDKTESTYSLTLFL